MSRPRKKAKAKGKWVFVPDEQIPEEERHRDEMEAVTNMLALGWTSDHPFAAAEQFHDYFPGDNMVPEGGGWILVKTPPPTEYTVPPFSIWFAEAWPMECERHDSHRVRIITPRGELGLFPREFSYVKDPAKYYEFVGQGMTIHFFGNETGVPKDALFYLRSRGVSKRDALCMLIADIKSHGVMWIETDPEIAASFGRERPAQYRLATEKTRDESPAEVHPPS